MEKISNYFYKAKAATNTNKCAVYLHKVSKLLTCYEHPTNALLSLDFCICMARHLLDRAGDRTVKALIINILRIGFDPAVVIGPMPPSSHSDLIALRTSCVSENIVDGILLFLLDMVQQLKENNDSLVLLEQQFTELTTKSNPQDYPNYQNPLDNSEQHENEQGKDDAIPLVHGKVTEGSATELSSISINIDQGTQQFGRTDLDDAVASESASNSASPSLLENHISSQIDMLGLQDIGSLQHKKYTEEKYSLLKERATLLDDVITLLFLLESILAIRVRPLVGSSLQKGTSQRTDSSRSLFNNFRGHEDDVFKTLLTICIAGNLPQLLVILVNLVSTDVMAGLAAPLLRLLTVLLHNQSLYSINGDTTQPLAFRRVKPPSEVKSPKIKLNIVGHTSSTSLVQERNLSKSQLSDALLSVDHPVLTSTDIDSRVRISRYASVNALLLSRPTITSEILTRMDSTDMMIGEYYLLGRKNVPRRPLGNTFTRLKAVAGTESIMQGLSDDSSIISDIDSITSSDNDTDQPKRGHSSTLTSTKTIPVHKIPVTWPYLSQPSTFTYFHEEILEILFTDNSLLTFVTYCMDHISSICQIGLGMQSGFSRQLLYTKQHSVETDQWLNNALLCCVFTLASQSAAYLILNTTGLSDTAKIERLGDSDMFNYIEASTRVLNSVFGGLQRNSNASSGFNDYGNWYVRDTGLSCFYWLTELVYHLGTAPISALGKRLSLLSAEKNSAALMSTLPPQAQKIATDALNKRLKSENEQLYKTLPIIQKASRPLRMSISCLHTLSYMLETWAPHKGAELQCLCYYAQLLSTEDRLHSMLEALSLTSEQSFSVAAGFATKSVTGRILTLDGSIDTDDDEPVAQFNINTIGDTDNTETEICTLGMFIARQISSSTFISGLLIFIDSMFAKNLFGDGQEEVYSLIFRILGLFIHTDMKDSGHTAAVFGNLESILVLLTFVDKSSSTSTHQTLKELANQILDIVCDPSYFTDENVTDLFKRSKIPAHRSLFFKHEAKKLDNILINRHNIDSIHDIRARHAGVTYRRDLNALVINKDLVTDAALEEIIGNISVTALQHDNDDDGEQQAMISHGRNNFSTQKMQISISSQHVSEDDDISSGSMSFSTNEDELQSVKNYNQCNLFCDNGFTPEINQLILTHIEREMKKGITLEDAMGTLMIELDCNFTVSQLIDQWKLLSIKSGRFSKEEDGTIIRHLKEHGGLGDAQILEIATILHRKPQAVKKRILSLQGNREARRRIKL